ncbi:MAG: hypothetical protein COA81_05065 [Alphaproteobacteria bacterium]|nr:MAG: hypothetical protein COA81_05065 [Alphaproteobacteria bacterium]
MMTIGQKKTFIGVRILWALALLLLLIVIAGGPGVHMGLWSPLDGFILSMRAGFMGGLALAILALVIIIIIAVKKKAGMGKAILSLLIGLLLAAPVGYLRLSGGGGVPPIHDIATDTANPLTFMALVGKRGEGANSITYAGGELAEQQKQAYPDVGPLLVDGAPDKVFSRTIDVARDMGWDITGVEAKVRRFEATDHSFWFNFADDVVVAVTATDTGSRIDLRSVSRVGRSDLGVNAKRIMAFQKNYTATP